MSEKDVSPLAPDGLSDDGDKTLSITAIEPSILLTFPESSDEDYPEGGRGWLVVAGCFLQAAVTLGTIIMAQ